MFSPVFVTFCNILFYVILYSNRCLSSPLKCTGFFLISGSVALTTLSNYKQGRSQEFATGVQKRRSGDGRPQRGQGVEPRWESGSEPANPQKQETNADFQLATPLTSISAF